LKTDEKTWNPYLAGALAGVLVVMSVWLAGKYFGASTTFARSAGIIEKTFAEERVSRMAYFEKYTPKVDWQFMFVVGVFLGSAVSSVTSGTFRKQAVPDMWRERFGPGIGKRAVAAFAGGAAVLFGSRLAGG
jgi:hypothetical protein